MNIQNVQFLKNKIFLIVVKSIFSVAIVVASTAATTIAVNATLDEYATKTENTITTIRTLKLSDMDQGKSS